MAESWKPAIPTPGFASAQAVAQLAAGHAGTWVDDSGARWTSVALTAAAQSMPASDARMPAHIAVGPDGKTYRYPFAWHPPDAENGTPGGHLGVEAWVSTAAAPPAPAPSPAPPPPPAPAYVEGVDVSHYQGQPDWIAMRARGVAFGFLKASEGTTLVDASYGASWPAAKAAGVLRGAYHFFRPAADARAQATHFLQVLGSDRGELPPALDVEVLDGVTGDQLAAGVLLWLQIVAAATGRRPLVYTSPSFWMTMIPHEQWGPIAAVADLWLAHWGGAVPGTVTGWNAPRFWQYSNVGPGGGDADRWCGTLAELQAYAGGVTIPAPPPTKPDLSTTKGQQHALNLLGASPQLVEDGKRGTLTIAATKAWQRARGLVDDGVIGPATTKALEAALAAL